MLGVGRDVVTRLCFEGVVLALQLRDFRFQPGVFSFQGFCHCWYGERLGAYLRRSGSRRSEGPS